MQTLPLILALAWLLLAGAGTQPAPIRVLFVGNSLTYANDVPALVAAMGKADGQPVVAEAVALPDFSLEDHWQQGDARRAIARGGWTTVVLQQGPSALPESRALLVEYARRFDREIRKAGATTALYMVWPSRTRRGDFAGVSRSYREAARATGGAVMPAGEAWLEAWKIDSGLALYGPDGFHPSAAGSYLAALVIYQQLTGHLPREAPATGVTPEQMERLRAAAAAVATK